VRLAVRMAFSHLKLLKVRQPKTSGRSARSEDQKSRARPIRRPRLPARRLGEVPWGRDENTEEFTLREASLVHPASNDDSESKTNGFESRPQRTKLKPREWLRLSRILRVDGLLKRRQLHFGTGRLLVLGLQVMEGLNAGRERRAYIDQVRYRVRETHRFYNDVAKGIFAPWGLNSLGLTLSKKELGKIRVNDAVRNDIICRPGGNFRKLLAKRFSANLGVFLRLNNAKLHDVLAKVRFRRTR